jgi:glycosyltransferase involved in cell wall biosynthesis
MSRADIALISPYPGRHQALTSGVATYSRNLARALAEAGLSVTVLAPEHGGRKEVEADGLVRVERCFRLGPGGLLNAQRAGHASGAPIVHLQHELFLYGGVNALPGMVAALRRAKAARQATVVTMHQIVNPAKVDPVFVRLHRIRVPAAAARIGIAAVQWGVQRLADAVIVHEEAFRRIVPHATAVPHGLEVVKSPDKAKARAELGLDDRFTVLCFGFLAPYKGFELACEAAEIACHSTNRIRLVIAGGEHPRLVARDPYAAALRARFGGTVWFPGFVADRDVPLWFAAADLALFLYPQPHATSGALALALAYGTPFLLSGALANLAGAPQALVANAEAAALAAQLQHLAGSLAARRDLAVRCARLADGRSWPAVAGRHLEVYKEVLNGDRAPGWSLRATRPR